MIIVDSACEFRISQDRRIMFSFGIRNIRQGMLCHMSNKKSNHYDVLGITNDANASEIKTAFYKLSKEYHPDRNQDDNAVKKFQEINDAYEVLGNYQTKKSYDRSMFPGQVKKQSDNGGSPTSSGNSPSASYVVNEDYTEFYKERLSKYPKEPGGVDSKPNDFNYQSFYQSHYSVNNPNPRIFRKKVTLEQLAERRNDELQSLFIRNVLILCIDGALMVMFFHSGNTTMPKVVLNSFERNKKGRPD